MTSQMSLLIFLLFFIQPHLKYALQSNNTRLEFHLDNFNGLLRIGDNTKLVHELKKHMVSLGYLHPNKFGSENSFDKHLKHAIKKYQEFYSLNVTGHVDTSMITSMCKPRCGFPDFFNPKTQFKSLYNLYPGNPKWGKTTLRYYIFETTPDAYRPAIESALQEWQTYTPFRFPRARNADPDIKFSFERDDHGDASPFYPHSEAIAHAERPTSGVVHFNAYKRWATNGDSQSIDIKTTALHELGHVLGLQHSTDPLTIMYPHIDLGDRKELHQDDINGIYALYGF